MLSKHIWERVLGEVSKKNLSKTIWGRVFVEIFEKRANIFKKGFCQKKINRILSTIIWERILMKLFVKRILSNNKWEKALQKKIKKNNIENIWRKKRFSIKVVEGLRSLGGKNWQQNC